MDPKMNCDAARGLLADLVGSELQGPDRAGLELHLASCEACRAEFAALAEANAMIARAAGSEADARAATVGLRAPFVTPMTPGPRWRRLSIAAGLLLAFAMGYAVRGPTGARTESPVASSPETVVSSFAKVTSAAPRVSPFGRAMLSLAQR